jgi:hypothetical protein
LTGLSGRAELHYGGISASAVRHIGGKVGEGENDLQPVVNRLLQRIRKAQKV